MVDRPVLGQDEGQLTGGYRRTPMFGNRSNVLRVRNTFHPAPGSKAEVHAGDPAGNGCPPVRYIAVVHEVTLRPGSGGP